MAQLQVILLERVEKLGAMGDVVTVKPGYARNYLLPQKKALRASKENMAYFDAQRKALEAENEKNRKAAEKLSEKLKDLKAPVIRQASEGGQLYGSVTSREIAEVVSEISGVKVERSMVRLNDNFKSIGLFDVDIALHPEVVVNVVINIARSNEEAKMQAESGKALTAGARQEVDSAETNLEDVLEDSALETEKTKQEKAAAKAVEDEEKAVKSAEKAAKKAAKKSKEEAESEEEVTEIGAAD